MEILHNAMETMDNVKNYVKTNVTSFFFKSCLPFVFVTFKYSYKIYSLSNSWYRKTNYILNHTVNHVVKRVFNNKTVLKSLNDCDGAVCINEKYYDSFKIYTYKIIKYKTTDKIKSDDWNNEWIEYIFDYIIRNDETNVETVTYETNVEMVTDLINMRLNENKTSRLMYKIKNTMDNIIIKNQNKDKILHVSLILEDETSLCELTSELQKLRYYLDEGEMYWKDVIEIVKEKYKNNEHARDIFSDNFYSKKIYVYMILNDSDLTTKTLLLSSVINEYVCEHL